MGVGCSPPKCGERGGFPKTRGTVLAVPIMRTTVELWSDLSLCGVGNYKIPNTWKPNQTSRISPEPSVPKPCALSSCITLPVLGGSRDLVNRFTTWTTGVIMWVSRGYTYAY